MRRVGFAGKLSIVSLLIAAAVTSPGCTPTWSSGTFRPVARVDTALIKGVSTKADALRLLGEPNGKGRAEIPGDPVSHEIWLYEDLEVSEKSSQEKPQRGKNFNLQAAQQLGRRQQVLLLFLDKETVSGYMWFSNEVSGQRR